MATSLLSPAFVLLLVAAGPPPKNTRSVKTQTAPAPAQPGQPGSASGPSTPPPSVNPNTYPQPRDPSEQPTYQAPRDRNPISTADRNPIGGQGGRGGIGRVACASAAECQSQLTPWQGQTIPWGRSRYFALGTFSAPPGGEPAPAAGPDLPLVLVGGGNAQVDLSGPQLINLLGDPLYSTDGKQQTEVELLAGGLSSVPALIGALNDRRSYGTRPVVTPTGVKSEPVTVGQQCEALLYQIITPNQRSRFEKPGMAVKDPVMFSVGNWNVWWEKNRNRPLELIHQDVAAAMDRYWQQGGTEQKL